MEATVTETDEEKAVIVTSAMSWCSNCEDVKSDAEKLKDEVSILKRDKLIAAARDVISEMVSQFYSEIQFEYLGNKISSYGDVYSIRKKLQPSEQQGLDREVLKSVSSIVNDPQVDVGAAFQVIRKFKASRYCDVHHRSCQSDVLLAIELYAENATPPFTVESSEFFKIVARKVCGSDLDDVDYTKV